MFQVQIKIYDTRNFGKFDFSVWFSISLGSFTDWEMDWCVELSRKIGFFCKFRNFDDSIFVVFMWGNEEDEVLKLICSWVIGFVWLRTFLVALWDYFENIRLRIFVGNKKSRDWISCIVHQFYLNLMAKNQRLIISLLKALFVLQC